MEKNCLNCKEFPTYGSVCSPFDVDQATFSCSGHLFDREDLLRRATEFETEVAELRARLARVERNHLRRMSEAAEGRVWKEFGYDQVRMHRRLVRAKVIEPIPAFDGIE